MLSSGTLQHFSEENSVAAFDRGAAPVEDGVVAERGHRSRRDGGDDEEEEQER